MVGRSPQMLLLRLVREGAPNRLSCLLPQTVQLLYAGLPGFPDTFVFTGWLMVCWLAALGGDYALVLHVQLA